MSVVMLLFQPTCLCVELCQIYSLSLCICPINVCLNLFDSSNERSALSSLIGQSGEMAVDGVAMEISPTPCGN